GVRTPVLTGLVVAASEYATRHGSRVLTEVLPSQPGIQDPWQQWVDPKVFARLGAARAVRRPWRHQVQAWEVLESGRHLALATATGSGKSLIAWAPALTAIRTPVSGRISEVSRPATALYLSPTKALANDQAEKLQEVLRAGEIRDVQVSVVDGDATPTERNWARERADVVFTNPDFLHYSLLPRAQRWQRLLRGLRYIFVDELHSYRGKIGRAHV